MKRALLTASLVAPVLVSTFACTTREKVFVVREPATQSASDDDLASVPVASTETSSASGGESDAPWGIVEARHDPSFAAVVRRVGAMVRDGDLQSRVRRRNLSLVNVMWEDTGRAQGSALGPNITDLTLQVRHREAGAFQETLMPVIRPPNFTDRTGDVAADKFFVRVGNERGSGALRTVALSDVLRNLSAFVSDPSSIGHASNLLATRDSHFLVSSQAVFLPVPKTGKAEFNPAVFNYQSAPGSPAVLTLLVTRQGTSVQVIDNRSEDRTSLGRGQELYFNDKGQRSAFSAERRSDVVQRIEAQGGPKNDDERSAIARGADVMFLVQVPLIHAHRGRLGGALPGAGGDPNEALDDFDGPASADSWSKSAEKKAPAKGASAAPAPPASEPAGATGTLGGARARRIERSDMENAVIGHGPHLGDYREGRGVRLVRDARFPVRITVQFYKATSNGVVSDHDLDLVARTLGGVYEHADFVGSLVMPDGDPLRPTSWQRVPAEWFPW